MKLFELVANPWQMPKAPDELLSRDKRKNAHNKTRMLRNKANRTNRKTSKNDGLKGSALNHDMIGYDNQNVINPTAQSV